VKSEKDDCKERKEVVEDNKEFNERN